MSQPEFLILGDSNVKRFYTKLGLSQAQNIEFVQARNMNEVTNSLSTIKNSFKFVIFAFLTNLVIFRALGTLIVDVIGRLYITDGVAQKSQHDW